MDCVRSTVRTSKKQDLLRIRDAIRHVRLLSIYPLLKEGLIDPNTIIIDAKSGTSGAGRGAKVANLYCEVNENIKAYGVATHRHTPEIEDQLGYACGQEVTDQFYTTSGSDEQRNSGYSICFSERKFPMKK